jgi:hypothetical protein
MFFSMVLYAQILTRRGTFFESAHRLQLLRQEQSLGQGLGTARRRLMDAIVLLFILFLFITIVLRSGKDARAKLNGKE